MPRRPRLDPPAAASRAASVATSSPGVDAASAAQPPASPRRRIPASDAVRREWLRRVEAEYRSAVITHNLVLWLLQLGASPDLIELGLRIVSDELAHANLSYRTFVAARGEGGPSLIRETLGLARDERTPLELDVVRAAVEVFCLGETVAVPLFAELRRPCVVPSARRALDRILRDEVRHRDFGWLLLGWLLDQPYGERLRVTVTSELPAMFERLRRSYGVAHASAPRTMPEDERAWGLMPVGLYGDILERAVTRDYEPRFAKLGINAIAAWRAAR
jgi:hypothetical protein